jgi:ectoine hydroxylase-related dioxygenase (phytanoyl-CoA dioxygenase family)
MILPAATLAEFNERGFTCLPQISSPAELQELRAIFEQLFMKRAGRKEGMQYDILGHDEDQAEQSLPTIINPSNYAPALRHLQCRDNAAAIARQLLGPRATRAFEQVILKPPMVGGPTPWHQDEAYRVDPDFAYQQVSIWMPLRDATTGNGCMQFIPGSHRSGILPHSSPGGDRRIHAIECAEGFDSSTAVACPLPAGHATVHHGRTLHFAGPNRSPEARYAFILSFEIPPEPLRTARNFYWNAEKQAPNRTRRRQWRMRGGIVIEGLRKLRAGMWREPARLAFEARRAVRALLSRQHPN